MIAILLSLAAAIQVPAAAQTPAPPARPRDPRNWPAAVVDTVPPPLPRLRGGAVLVLTKTNGYRDPDQIAAATIAIPAIVREHGRRDVFATENAAVMNPRDLARFRVVVLASTSGDVFSPGQRAAFRAWIERGGGVVLLHGAGGDMDYAWDWYRDVLLGSQFVGHTHAPQFQQGSIDVIVPAHPVMAGLPRRWTRSEEWYAFDRVPEGQGTQLLATLDETSYQPPDNQRMGTHPLIWTRCIARGRAVFSALGHRADTYAEPLHRRLIANAINWAAGTRC